MERFLTRYTHILKTLDWQLRVLTLRDLGILAGLLVVASYLLTFHGRLLVVIAQCAGVLLFVCALSVGMTLLARTDTPDDYVDVE